MAGKPVLAFPSTSDLPSSPTSTMGIGSERERAASCLVRTTSARRTYPARRPSTSSASAGCSACTRVHSTGQRRAKATRHCVVAASMTAGRHTLQIVRYIATSLEWVALLEGYCLALPKHASPSPFRSRAPPLPSSEEGEVGRGVRRGDGRRDGSRKGGGPGSARARRRANACKLGCVSHSLCLSKIRCSWLPMRPRQLRGDDNFASPCRRSAARDRDERVPEAPPSLAFSA